MQQQANTALGFTSPCRLQGRQRHAHSVNARALCPPSSNPLSRPCTLHFSVCLSLPFTCIIFRPRFLPYALYLYFTPFLSQCLSPPLSSHSTPPPPKLLLFSPPSLSRFFFHASTGLLPPSFFRSLSYIHTCKLFHSLAYMPFLTHCTTLHHTCTTLHYTAPHRTILYHTCTTLHHTAPHCTALNTLQRTIYPVC